MKKKKNDEIKITGIILTKDEMQEIYGGEEKNLSMGWFYDAITKTWKKIWG